MHRGVKITGRVKGPEPLIAGYNVKTAEKQVRQTIECLERTGGSMIREPTRCNAIMTYKRGVDVITEKARIGAAGIARADTGITGQRKIGGDRTHVKTGTLTEDCYAVVLPCRASRCRFISP